jgi:AraC-like DNA-binding protein
MKKYTVCVHLLDHLLRYAAEKGMDRATICTNAGLDPVLFENPDARVRVARFIDVWQQTARTLADARFGLNLGRSLQHFPFGHIAVSVMLNSRDLLSALKNLIRYHNLMSDVGCPGLEPEQGGMVCFSVQPPPDAAFHDQQYVVFIFAMVVSLLRYLDRDQTLSPVAVELAGSDMYPGLEDFFRAGIVYHQPVNRMMFGQKDLSRRILFSNPDLLRLLEQAAQARLSQLDQGGTWSAKVRGILETTMNPEQWTIDNVAQKLHLQTRTLQNYLSRENTGFRRVYMEFRKEKAMQFLRDPSVAMIDIAFFLGFSEQSAFNHPFITYLRDITLCINFRYPQPEALDGMLAWAWKREKTHGRGGKGYFNLFKLSFAMARPIVTLTTGTRC